MKIFGYKFKNPFKNKQPTNNPENSPSASTKQVPPAVSPIKIPVPPLVLSPPPAPLNPPMPLLIPIADSTDLFRLPVNENIANLNKLINAYNTITNKDDKLNKLKEIHHYRKMMDDKYQPEYMAGSVDYQKQIHVVLFNALKKEFSNFGDSLPVEGLNQKSVTTQHTTPRSVDALSGMITNMPPEKASKLLAILLLENTAEISRYMTQLYNKKEPGYKEYAQFLSGHSVEYLGGGNSRNFKITARADQSTLVLKIDNRLNMPKAAASQLREGALSDVLTLVATERQVTCLQKGKPITRTMLTTEYCEGSDLETYAKKDLHKTSALNLFHQMGHILERTRQAGFAWPDSKNSNWMVDNGVLRISDTKAFLPAADGMVNQQRIELEGYGLLRTPYISPPEFYSNRNPNFNVDKMNSYLMGKNLYAYLTGSIGGLRNRHDAEKYDFTAPIFNTKQGQCFKELIQKMVKPNAADRISVESALFELSRHTRNELNELLSQIKSHGFGKDDEQMNAFIAEKTNKIEQTTTVDALATINQELNALLDNLKASPAKKIQATIQSFRENARFYTIGMKTKADKIEQAVCSEIKNMPLEQRINWRPVMTAAAPTDLHKALASNRHVYGLKLYTKEDGSIDEKKAAKSFKEFKAQFKETIPAAPENQSPTTNKPGRST